MRECRRGQAPAVLIEHGAAISAEYAARRGADSTYTFEWRRTLRPAIRDALAEMTQEHCAYCDGDLRSGTTEEHIDHFRPKSRPEFYALVCAWENLFLVCSPCNKAKGHFWDDLLLKPDDLDFRFSRYFSYAYDTDRLEPNLASSAEDVARARKTIDLLKLNAPKHCTSRRRVRELFDKLPEEDRQHILSYRFLFH